MPREMYTDLAAEALQAKRIRALVMPDSDFYALTACRCGGQIRVRIESVRGGLLETGFLNATHTRVLDTCGASRTHGASRFQDHGAQSGHKNGPESDPGPMR